MKKIIFTDLDGTLLDHNTYSFKAALPALKTIKKKKIPLIICTSKTKAEIESYRKKLRNKDPFISENGGAIFIPKKYFDFKFKRNKETKDYFVIELGAECKEIRKVVKKIKKKGIKIMTFDDMSVKELAKDTGLPLKRARLAKKREYDIAFKLQNRKDEKKIFKIIKKNKLNYTKGGRYYHIMGKSSKGKAVKITINLYKKQYKSKIESIALGDSKNDFEMLKAVSKSFLVKRFDGSYASKKFKKAKGIGPRGWNKAVNALLKRG